MGLILKGIAALIDDVAGTNLSGYNSDSAGSSADDSSSSDSDFVPMANEKGYMSNSESPLSADHSCYECNPPDDD